MACLHEVSLLVFGFLLKVRDVAQLVHGQDVVVGRAHIVLKIDAVLGVIRKVTLTFELINAIEAIVAPALANLELTLVDSEDHLRWAQVVNQLNTIFIHLWLHRLRVLWSLIHL